LPAEYFKSAEFCAMCGPKFCSMHHSRTIEEGIAKMAAEIAVQEGKQLEHELQLAGASAS
jgi:thiamine biosynthesis protein ThiC